MPGMRRVGVAVRRWGVLGLRERDSAQGGQEEGETATLAGLAKANNGRLNTSGKRLPVSLDRSFPQKKGYRRKWLANHLGHGLATRFAGLGEGVAPAYVFLAPGARRGGGMALTSKGSAYAACMGARSVSRNPEQHSKAPDAETGLDNVNLHFPSPLGTIASCSRRALGWIQRPHYLLTLLPCQGSLRFRGPLGHPPPRRRSQRQGRPRRLG